MDRELFDSASNKKHNKNVERKGKIVMIVYQNENRNNGVSRIIYSRVDGVGEARLLTSNIQVQEFFFTLAHQLNFTLRFLVSVE